MHNIVNTETLNSSSMSEETRVLTTDSELPVSIPLSPKERRIIVVQPAADFGGGSAVAQARVKPRGI